MKKNILQIIYDAFADWTADDQWACRKGCASCCTQNVAITALEGERILEFIQNQKMEEWFIHKLQHNTTPHRPSYSTNTLARACLNGKELPEEKQPATDQCPFLENSTCMIYPARPFNCRCFLSQQTCSPERPALVSEQHLAASTALNQLIEHLGQSEYWGNMLDVLPALLDISRYSSIATHLPHPATTITGARSHTLRGQPLPGFVLGPEDYEHVTPLLEIIFQQRIAGTTVEDILNGK